MADTTPNTMWWNNRTRIVYMRIIGRALVNLSNGNDDDFVQDLTQILKWIEEGK